MPQDGLRSAIYRSFVTCDDPKGVVNCRTIRKSKTDSRKMDHQRRESKRKLKSLSTTSLDYKGPAEGLEDITMASKGITEEIQSPASFQLMEVSRGAQKLNQMIECWSKGIKFDGQSKDIAKDLLKGALDLQDSLIMLGKLQEASQYIAHLKKKQMEKKESGREDEEAWIGRSYSDQFGDKYSMTEFQRPRFSLDGSSRNSTEELKNVIRESLVRRNMLPKTRKQHERAYYLAQRNLDSASTSESPSTTSSSQSSTLTRPITDSPAASASTAPQVSKSPNLIAKLMGLEEYPLRSSQAITPRKQFEGQKTLNQRRPVFDIDMPRVKGPQYGVQKVDPERRTLKEILETMQFKGLLRSSSPKGVRPCLDHPNASHSKLRSIDEGPPIVLIKPLRVPCLELKETPRPVFEEEDPLYRRKMLSKLRRKEELHHKKINYREGTLTSNKINIRLEAEETSIQGLKHEGAKEQREIVEEPVEKEVVLKETAPIKSKASLPANYKQQRNDTIEKRADKVQKVNTTNRKPLEKDVVKVKSVSKSEDQPKKASIKAGKLESESKIPKSQMSQQSSAKPNAIKQAEQGAACSNSSHQKKNRTKREKPVKKPTPATSVTETSVREEDNKKKIDHTIESDCHVVTIDTNIEIQLAKLEDQPPKEEDIVISESQIGELCKEGQISLFEVTLPRPGPERKTDNKIAEESPKDIDICKNTDTKPFNSECSLRALLLSSLSFQNRAEELFNLNTSSSSNINQTCFINDEFRATNMRLSLDCANELIERKSFQVSQTVLVYHPLILPTCVAKLRQCISIETLVEEVCGWLETLLNYSKLAGESLLVDFLYAMLETDLMCRGVVNGIWDFGWRTGFSLDEAEQVVNDIEKLVLSGLIEEVFA